MKLSEEQRQSLITSLLGFVRRVSFHGADSPEEAETLPILASLLLGESWLFNSEGSPAFVREKMLNRFARKNQKIAGRCIVVNAVAVDVLSARSDVRVYRKRTFRIFCAQVA